MNEPLVATEERSAGQWTLPLELEGLRYAEFLNLDPAGRKASDIEHAGGTITITRGAGTPVTCRGQTWR
jgi:hypothetical protein